LIAILGVLFAEDRIDHAFVAAHVAAGELDAVRAAMARPTRSPTRARAPASTRRWSGAPRRRSAGARAFASFEDLGVQMNHHSTVVSYLHRVLIVVTGSLGKPRHALLPDHAGRHRRRRGQAHEPGGRRAAGRRAGALQRDRRRDLDRAPGATARCWSRPPTRPTRWPTRRACGRPWPRSTRWW
jgi:anaerobic selenocysteine-containing dehydrogenase